MGGVDVLDQHVAAFRALRRVKKYWKTIFLDMVDIAVVNYILCKKWHRANQNSEIAEKLGCRIGHLVYREKLVRELGNLGKAHDIP